MSFGNTFENDLVKLIFQAEAIANIADNAGTSPLTDLYVALHTADPGEAGTQDTSEGDYGTYARVAVARSAAGWTVTGNVANPAANIDFPESGGAGTTLTHASIGVASSGATKILASAALSESITVTTGTIPRLTTATAFTLD